MEKEKPKSFIIKTNKNNNETKEAPNPFSKTNKYEKKQPTQVLKKGKEGLKFDNNSEAMIQAKLEINRREMGGLAMNDHFMKENKTYENDAMQKNLMNESQVNNNYSISNDDAALLKTYNLDQLEQEVAKLEKNWDIANSQVRELSINIYNSKEILRSKEKTDDQMEKEQMNQKRKNLEKDIKQKKQTADYTKLEERVAKKEAELAGELNNMNRAQSLNGRLSQQEQHVNAPAEQSFMNLGDILSNLMPDFEEFRVRRTQENNANGNSHATGNRNTVDTGQGVFRLNTVNNMQRPAPPPPPSGLTEQQIKDLPKFRFDPATMQDSMFDCCTICYFQYAEMETVRKLPCQHCFHSRCIKTWLSNNPECPLCKIRVIPR